MINHLTLLAGGGSQGLYETGSFQDRTSEGRRPDSAETILNLLKIMSDDIRSSLLSMLATLKLLNRGYYGRMDEGVAHQINDLLSCATHLTGIAEECLGRTFAGNEKTEIDGAKGVMDDYELNAPNKQVSTETKENALVP